jgi:predicted RNase H-like HicB family nuclease
MVSHWTPVTTFTLTTTLPPACTCSPRGKGQRSTAPRDHRAAHKAQPAECSYRSLAENHTFGESVENALAMARDAIELSIAVRRDEGTEIPPPDAGEGRLETVAVNPHAA